MEDAYQYARLILAMAICVKLVHQRWTISAMPGEAIKLTKQMGEFEPFKAISDLFEKKLTILAWQEMCQKAGIYEMNVGLD